MQSLMLRALKAHMVLLLSSVMFFTTGCEDDSHDDHDEEHTDADGFILEDESGTEIYREFEGAMTGGVALSVGETLELSVHFLDHEGNEIEHGDDHEEEELKEFPTKTFLLRNPNSLSHSLLLPLRFGAQTPSQSLSNAISISLFKSIHNRLDDDRW